MLVATAAIFVAAFAVPEAFRSHAVVFGIAFLIVNLMHVSLFTLAGRGASTRRTSPSVTG